MYSRCLQTNAFYRMLARVTRRTAPLFTLFAVLALGGCAGSTVSTSAQPKISAEDAREAYEQALLRFFREDCMGADPLFRAIRREHPFSRFAALSELRIGDCQLMQKQHAEAIETFKTFIRFRPSHREVPYARFMIAKGHFEQIPNDWFLAPPSHERELSPARETVDAVSDFIRRHPDDERIEEASEMAKKALTILANHELYVSNFYERAKQYDAAARRLDYLLRHYQGSGKEAEALLRLGRIYRKMKRFDDAQSSFEILIATYGESEEAEEAARELRSLPKEKAERP
ncbi:MAG: outer membrane protein assembly factor BamD [Sandaracinaceae bacterium]|nr:outer membrane protein assembly factor BamD [Sandaracinaceae bacterium]